MFKHAGKTMYAVRGNKPQGYERPERRCLFADIKIANELERFMKRESTFDDIRIDSITV